MTESNKKQGWIVLGVTALLLLLFFAYQNNWGKGFDWRITFDEKSNEPYGTLVAKEILTQFAGADAFTLLDKKIAESLPKNAGENSNYVFIGEALLLDTSDVDALLDFVDAGNTAFIASLTIPDVLMNHVFLNPCDTLYWEDYFSYYDTAVITNFTHPDLKDMQNFVFEYVHKHKIQAFYWSAFADYVFCDSLAYPVVVAQSPDSLVNMALFPYGDGAFYLQTTPLAFTNYYLTTKSGQQYAEKVFTHLQKGAIYWDGFSNVPEQVGRSKNWANDPLQPKEGPLDYILSQPPLAWAWYLLLALAFLYLLFRAKRRQRVIPVIEENRNTSLAFISTIGRMHFSGQNHRQIALQKMGLLKAFIRSNYKISAKEIEGDFTTKLSMASEIDESIIQKIFLIDTNIQSSNFVSDKTLIELHQLIHHFYTNCT